ncbi:hypothetical protein Aglo01_24460 [Actinokineospora globicatena]|nr:hypothetical protein Aglo01_24460 [Actinokineospora globicatena]
MYAVTVAPASAGLPVRSKTNRTTATATISSATRAKAAAATYARKETVIPESPSSLSPLISLR